MQHLRVKGERQEKQFIVLPDAGGPKTLSVPITRSTGVDVPKENIRDAGKWTQQPVLSFEDSALLIPTTLCRLRTHLTPVAHTAQL